MIVESGLILLNILCYGDIRWLLLEQILLFPCFNVLKRKKREKEKRLYEKGFQDLLQSMMTSLQAGYTFHTVRIFLLFSVLTQVMLSFSISS